MTEAVDIDKLTRPFPREAIRWRWADRAQSRRLDYVEGHTVVHRLNDATGNRWNFRVDRIERFPIDEKNTLVMAYVTLEIPGLGRRSHIGVQAVNERGGEDLVKGAVTDALKKAATLFGVGLELYGPDYEAGELPTEPAPMPVPASTRERREPAPNGEKPMIQNPAAPASDNQLNYIRGLAKQMGMVMQGPDGDDHVDETALKAAIGIDYDADWPAINKGKASEIIEGFKGELKRRATA